MNRRQLLKTMLIASLAPVLAPMVKLTAPSRMFQGWWCPYMPLMVTRVTIREIDVSSCIPQFGGFSQVIAVPKFDSVPQWKGVALAWTMCLW